MIQNAGQPTAKTVSATEQVIDQVQLALQRPESQGWGLSLHRPNRKGGGTIQGYLFYGWYTAQIGNGMAEMLSDALLQSKRFIVLDRQALQDVLQEQDLAA